MTYGNYLIVPGNAEPLNITSHQNLIAPGVIYGAMRHLAAGYVTIEALILMPASVKAVQMPLMQKKCRIFTASNVTSPRNLPR